jgi:hypothetical protein
LCRVKPAAKEKFITGQNEREETTQDAIVTKSAAFASYEILQPKILTVSATNFSRESPIFAANQISQPYKGEKEMLPWRIYLAMAIMASRMADTLGARGNIPAFLSSPQLSGRDFLFRTRKTWESMSPLACPTHARASHRARPSVSIEHVVLQWLIK